MMKKQILLAIMTWMLAATGTAQDSKSGHNSSDPKQCKKCWPAYEKAVAYVQKNLSGRNPSFSAQMIMGWVYLADGGFPGELKLAIKKISQWKDPNNKWTQSWHPVFAGMLISEYQRFFPSQENLNEMQKIVDHFVKVQERTGGWFKYFEGAYKEEKNYAVRDLGILDGMIMGFLWSARTHGVKVPQDTLNRGEKCLLAILSKDGIGYGSTSLSGDITGARGGLCMLGLEFSEQRYHKIWKTYEDVLPRHIPNMNKGHHIGAFHCFGVALGCHLLGAATYKKLTAQWLDYYIDRQTKDGAVYIGDDGEAGGEKGLLGSDYASTASFALMVLLQDTNRLRPPKQKKP